VIVKVDLLVEKLVDMKVEHSVESKDWKVWRKVDLMAYLMVEESS